MADVAEASVRVRASIDGRACRPEAGLRLVARCRRPCAPLQHANVPMPSPPLRRWSRSRHQRPTQGRCRPLATPQRHAMPLALTCPGAPTRQRGTAARPPTSRNARTRVPYRGAAAQPPPSQPARHERAPSLSANVRGSQPASLASAARRRTQRTGPQGRGEPLATQSS